MTIIGIIALKEKFEYEAERFFLESYSSANYQLKANVKSCPFNLNSFDGKVCGFNNIRFSRIVTHYVVHSGLKFSCDKCDQFYYHIRPLKRHYNKGVHMCKEVDTRVGYPSAHFWAGQSRFLGNFERNSLTNPRSFSQKIVICMVCPDFFHQKNGQPILN